MRVILALFATVLALPVAASASEYFPNEPSDAYRYRDDHGVESSALVIASAGVGKLWSNFAGLGPDWICTTPASEEVYRWTGAVFQFLFDLGQPVGTTFPLELGCATRATIVEKGAITIVPAGTFHDTVTLQVDSRCADDGVETIVFARGVGPVLYAVRTVAGVSTHELLSTSRLRANPWVSFALSPVALVAADDAETEQVGPYAGAAMHRRAGAAFDAAP